MESPHLVQFSRIASGYIPGASETFANGTSPKSAVLQNCTAIRVAAGIIDVLIGPPQDGPLNQTELRSKIGPAPVGLGGTFTADPPLNVVGGGIIVNQGRARATVRSTLTNPVTSVNPQVTYAVQYGAEFGPVRIYPLFDNAQIVRFIFSLVDVNTNVDFDFDIERVIDPSVEP